MGLIQIEGMEFYAYHGCLKEEQIVGNKFLLDLQIETDLSKAAQTDNIKDALNYQSVYELVRKEMILKSHLLEHIANRIITTIYDNYPEVIKLTIKVSKMNPPIGGKVDCVSVTISR